jgi:hypothetical protein
MLRNVPAPAKARGAIDQSADHQEHDQDSSAADAEAGVVRRANGGQRT